MGHSVLDVKNDLIQNLKLASLESETRADSLSSGHLSFAHKVHASVSSRQILRNSSISKQSLA